MGVLHLLSRYRHVNTYMHTSAHVQASGRLLISCMPFERIKRIPTDSPYTYIHTYIYTYIHTCANFRQIAHIMHAI